MPDMICVGAHRISQKAHSALKVGRETREAGAHVPSTAMYGEGGNSATTGYKTHSCYSHHPCVQQSIPCVANWYDLVSFEFWDGCAWEHSLNSPVTHSVSSCFIAEIESAVPLHRTRIIHVPTHYFGVNAICTSHEFTTDRTLPGSTYRPMDTSV